MEVNKQTVIDGVTYTLRLTYSAPGGLYTNCGTYIRTGLMMTLQQGTIARRWGAPPAAENVLPLLGTTTAKSRRPLIWAANQVALELAGGRLGVISDNLLVTEGRNQWPYTGTGRGINVNHTAAVAGFLMRMARYKEAEYNITASQAVANPQHPGSSMVMAWCISAASTQGINAKGTIGPGHSWPARLAGYSNLQAEERAARIASDRRIFLGVRT